MTAVKGNGDGRVPTADELLAHWRARFRAADVDALTDLYHREAFLLGSTATPSVGRDEIHDYFASLGSTSGADVEFSEVRSRLMRSGVLLVLARAEFSAPGVSLPMWLTQVWVEDWAGWIVASHHAAPVANVRNSSTARV